jgi:hypothetical protein
LDQSVIPDWIKAEIAAAEEDMPRRQPVKSPEKQKKSSHQNNNHTSDEEHIKRMQREFEVKRRELLLEAENVVRMREEAFNQQLIKLQTELEKQKRLQEEHMNNAAKNNKESNSGQNNYCVIQ